MILVSEFHMMSIEIYKTSASVAVSSETQLTGIQSSDIGLVQAIADNFYANITSPNALK